MPTSTTATTAPRSRTPLPPRALLAAAGVGLTLSAAHAQSTIEWATPVDGDFSVAGNWSPMVVPGAVDTARFGGAGSYSVSTGTRSLGAVAFTNPDAVLAIVPGGLTVGHIAGQGVVLVNRDMSGGDSDLILTGGAMVSARIVLNTAPGADLRDAQVYYTRSGAAPTITADGSIVGRGQIFYDLMNNGLIEATGPEGFISFNQGVTQQGDGGVVRAVSEGTFGLYSGATVTGGSWEGDAGRLAGNGGAFGDTTVGGTWAVEPSNTVGLVGATDGDGVIVVNRTQSAGDAGLILNGGARVGIIIDLNASPDTTDLRDAQCYFSRSGDAPRITEDGVLTGRGQYVYNLINDGTIVAAGTDDNVQFTNATVTQGATGLVRAVDGGTIGLFGGSTLSGGRWDGGDDGRLQGNGGSLGNASVAGIWAVDPNNTIGLGGEVDGDGTIVVNRTRSAGDAGLILNGGAEVGITIDLNASPSSTDLRDAQCYFSRSGDAPRITENGVLTGRGQYYYNLINDGTILAVGLEDNVQFNSASVAQGTTGVVRSVDGGTIGLFGGSTITGGAWDGGDDGRLQGNGGSLGDASVAGIWAVDSSNTIGLSGEVDGDGTIIVNRTRASGDAGLVLNDGVEIGCVIELNASPDTTDLRDAQCYFSRTGDAPRITESGALRGRGQYYYNLINDGTIQAVGEDDYVQFNSASVTQGTTGVVRGEGGTIGLFSGSVFGGGTWEGDDGRLAGNGGRLGDASMTGTWAVEPSSTIGLAGEITGDGELLVNRTSSSGDASVELHGGARIGIRITLNASQATADLRDAQLYFTRSGDRPVITESGAIAGRGRVYYDLEVAGELSPGVNEDDVSLLETSSIDMELTPTARVTIDAAGAAPTEHDRIAGSGTITLDGTLDVDFVDGYVPEARDQYEIINATTVDGAFADIDIEPVGAIGPAHIVYTGTGVIVVICAADRDADGELTIFDFLAFQNLFSAGDLRADLDQDGMLTIFDFLTYQNRFAAGCG